jgi:hypothetical protein
MAGSCSGRGLFDFESGLYATKKTFVPPLAIVPSTFDDEVTIGRLTQEQKDEGKVSTVSKKKLYRLLRQGIAKFQEERAIALCHRLDGYGNRSVNPVSARRVSCV